MGEQVASLYGLLALDDREFTRGMNAADSSMDSMANRLDKFGAKVSGLGVQLSVLTQPLADFRNEAIESSLEFGKNMTNAQAAAGYTSDEINALNQQILEMGGASTSGPIKATEAFYDIAGGVANADARLAVLQTSLDVTTAGAAELTGVTDTLVKTMNIYGFAAEDAAHVGDVLTRTVGMGVGTMDEFGAALPPVEGLANELGLTFDEVGGYMAYMSSKSSSVATGGTQLRGVFSKLLNPSKELADVIEAMGYASGQALIEQEGLVGGLNKIKDFGGGSFAGIITDQEALLGAIALTTDGTETFLQTYKEGIDGATAAAKAIQEKDPTAQMAKLDSMVQTLKISIGDALVPAMMRTVEIFKPILEGIIGWVQQNPELTAQIGMLVGGLTLLGPVLMAIGAGISGVGAVLGFILSPIGLIVAGAAALFAAFQTNFMGIRDVVQPIIQDFFGFIGNVWAQVQPALVSLFDWFMNTGLPAIGEFITGTVLPKVQEFFGFIQGAWDTIAPALASIFDWFMTTGLPAIKDFIEGTVQPAIEGFFDIIEGAWVLIAPVLGDIYDWFVTTGLPEIKKFIDSVGQRIDEFINTLAGIWVAVEGPLNSLRDGILAVLQPIMDMIDKLIGGFDSLRGMAGEQANAQQAVAASGISKDALWQQTLGAAGGNDFMARIAFASIGDSARADGGDVMGGQSYLVGERGPELFTPTGSGTITPNRELGGGMQISIGQIVANSYEGGQAAAQGFEAEIRELMRR